MQLRLVNHETATESTTQHNLFITEASILGLRPGEVPEQLATTIGNHLNFQLVEATDHLFFYEQPKSVMLLHVLND